MTDARCVNLGEKKVQQKELQRSLLSSSHLRSLKPHHVHVSPLARSFLASLSQSRGGWHRSKREELRERYLMREKRFNECGRAGGRNGRTEEKRQSGMYARNFSGGFFWRLDSIVDTA